MEQGQPRDLLPHIPIWCNQKNAATTIDSSAVSTGKFSSIGSLWSLNTTELQERRREPLSHYKPMKCGRKLTKFHQFKPSKRVFSKHRKNSSISAQTAVLYESYTADSFPQRSKILKCFYLTRLTKYKTPNAANIIRKKVLKERSPKNAMWQLVCA